MPFPSYLTSKNSLRQQVSHRNTFLSCAFVVLTLWEVNVPDAVIAGRIKNLSEDGLEIPGAKDFLLALSRHRGLIEF